MLQQNPHSSLPGEPPASSALLGWGAGTGTSPLHGPVPSASTTPHITRARSRGMAPGMAWERVRLCPCWGGGGGWGEEGMLRHHSRLHSPAPAKSRSPLPPSSLELQHFCPSKVGCSHHGPAARKTLRAHGSSRRAGSAPRAHCLSLSSFKLFPSLFSPLCGSFDHII